MRADVCTYCPRSSTLGQKTTHTIMRHPSNAKRRRFPVPSAPGPQSHYHTVARLHAWSRARQAAVQLPPAFPSPTSPSNNHTIYLAQRHQAGGAAAQKRPRPNPSESRITLHKRAFNVIEASGMPAHCKHTQLLLVRVYVKMQYTKSTVDY